MVHTQFNWYWYHVPSFAPYNVEGTFFPLILSHCNASQSAKTATIVLQSLTPNAQSVFKILAEYQLSHPDEEGKWRGSIITKLHVSSYGFSDSHFIFQGCQLIACIQSPVSAF